MNRRDALKYSTFILGYAATGTAIAALASGCRVEPKLNWIPDFMTEEEAKTIATIVDMILPKTESPSGTEVGVPEFLDGMLNRVADAEEQVDFKAGMKEINANVQKEKGKFFNELAEEEKLAFITALDVQAFEKLAEGATRSVDQRLWRKLKSNTYFSYFTSEKIGKEVLNYLPSPGAYQGCVNLSVSGGKLWAV